MLPPSSHRLFASIVVAGMAVAGCSATQPGDAGNGTDAAAQDAFVPSDAPAGDATADACAGCMPCMEGCDMCTPCIL